MNCYYHQEREAESYCPRCGKALCRECADEKSGFCPDCMNFLSDINESEIQNEKQLLRRKATWHVLLTTGAMIVGFFIAMGITWFMFVRQTTYNLPFDNRTISTYYLTAFIPFAWLTIGLFINYSGCLTFLAYFLITPWFGAIFYVLFLILTSIKVYRASKTPIRGVLGIAGYVIFELALCLFLYFLYMGLRCI